MIRSTSFVAAAMALVVSACSLNLPNVQLPNLNDAVLSCSAVLAPEAGGVVISGQPAPIKVKAKGGVAPYEVLGSAITFDSETVIARTYTNNTSSNQIVVDYVQVKDHVGLVSQCGFILTVSPVSNPSTLACTLAGTPAAPSVNQNISFLATASGGTAPYSFSNLNLGSGATVVSPLASTSATQAAAVAKYSSSGLRAPNVKLTDDLGTEVICSTSVDVQAAPAISVVASPSNSVVMGNPITLTATPSGFSTTPTYTFTTARAGVSISSTGNTASVTSATVQSAFNVVVTATAGTQSASQTISLSFTSAGSLACSITHPAGILYTGENILFNVVAANGHALEITYFATHSDGVLMASTDSSRTVKYSVAGPKTVLMQAKSKVSGALCQNGGIMSDSIEATAPAPAALSCTGLTSPNPSYSDAPWYYDSYNWFTASATISGGQGSKWVDQISIKRNGNSFSSYEGYWVDALSAKIWIYISGSYEIKFHVKDSIGQTGTCTTTQVVWSWF